MAEQLNLTVRLDELGIAAGDAGRRRRVLIRAYAGGILNVAGGPTVIDLAGLELPQTLLLLADHDERTESIVGHGRPQTDGRELAIDGELTASTPAGQRVAALLADGVPLAASVGVEVVRWRTVKAGEKLLVNGRELTAGERGLRVVEKGTLREVSLLPLGADRGASASLAAGGNGNMREANMSDDLEPIDVIAAERRRVADIIAACGGRHRDIESKAVAEGWTVERTKAELLDRIRTERPAPPWPHPRPARPTAEPRRLLAAATLRLLGRHDLVEPDLAEPVESLGVSNAIDLCRAALSLAGEVVPTGKAELVRAAASTASLPAALGAAGEKVALDAYRQAPATWRSFARVVSANSFREHTAIRLAGATQLQEVAPDGEIKHGTLAEETATYRVETYGRMLGIDRRMIVNDDLGILDSIPAAFGRAAARKVADLLYSVLLGNAGSFFSTGHGNLLTGAGSALSITSLGQAVALLRNQTDADGLPLDLVPAALLVPPALEATARQLLNSTEVSRSGADQLPAGNPFLGLNLVLAVEPRLESTAFAGASATAWYLLAGPADGPFLVAFLDGREGPVIESSEADFERLGLQWRVYLDAGAAQGDHRAAVKANGA